MIITWKHAIVFCEEETMSFASFGDKSCQSSLDISLLRGSFFSDGFVLGDRLFVSLKIQGQTPLKILAKNEQLSALGLGEINSSWAGKNGGGADLREFWCTHGGLGIVANNWECETDVLAWLRLAKYWAAWIESAVGAEEEPFCWLFSHKYLGPPVSFPYWRAQAQYLRRVVPFGQKVRKNF